jgi:uncharacterized metal-binding protein
MNFRSHLTGGALASTVLTVGYSFLQKPPINQDDLALMFGACLIGSLAPDLDTQSKPSKFLSIVLTVFGIWSIVNREPYPALFCLTGFAFIKSFNHRTWCHVYSLPLVLTLVSVQFNLWWLIPFSVGLVVHYACDKLNPLQFNNWFKKIII